MYICIYQVITQSVLLSITLCSYLPWFSLVYMYVLKQGDIQASTLHCVCYILCSSFPHGFKIDNHRINIRYWTMSLTSRNLHQDVIYFCIFGWYKKSQICFYTMHPDFLSNSYFFKYLFIDCLYSNLIWVNV